ncbi:MAG: hypothetical protein AAFO01_20395, partial [Pseudomonadota bacterium]
SMENFSSNQDQIRHYIEGTFGRFFPMGQFEDMARQNIALFQQAATMFNPATGEKMGTGMPGAESGRTSPEQTDALNDIQELSAKIEALQAELSKLVEAQKDKAKR